MRKDVFRVKGALIVDQCGAVLYDLLEDMPMATRIRLAELHTQKPRLDWEGAERILKREGYPLKLTDV
jgi:hypothetical protein